MKNNLSIKSKSVEKLLLDFFKLNFLINLQPINVSSTLIYACDSFFCSFSEYDDFDNVSALKMNFTFTNCNIINSNIPTKTYGRNDIQFGSSTLKNLCQNISPNTVLNINTNFVDLQTLLKSPSTYKVPFSTFVENKSMFYYILELHTYLLSSQYASLLELKDLIAISARPDSSTQTNNLIVEEKQNEITFNSEPSNVVHSSSIDYSVDPRILGF